MYRLENIMYVWKTENWEICKAAFLVYLILLSYMDIKWRKVYMPVLLSGVIFMIWGRVSADNVSVVLSAAGILTGIVFLIISRATQEAFGYGDSILITVTGCFLGFWNTLYILFGAFSISAVFSVFLLLFRKFSKKASFPFIPFLTASYIGGMIVGIY